MIRGSFVRIIPWLCLAELLPRELSKLMPRTDAIVTPKAAATPIRISRRLPETTKYQIRLLRSMAAALIIAFVS